MTIQQTLAHFEELKTYEDNWDGYGAPKPTAQVIEAGRQFALRMDRVLSAAGLQYRHGCANALQWSNEPQRMYFEWLRRNADGSFADGSLSISILEDGLAMEYMTAWLKENATSPADLEFKEGYITDAQIVELWKWLEAKQ
jgi:hypothetical protein